MLCKSRKCTNMRKASHWDVTNQVTEISLDLTDVDIFSQLSDKQPHKSEYIEGLYVLKNNLSITWHDGGNILVV